MDKSRYLHQLVSQTFGWNHAQAFPIEGVSVDSRKITGNDLFFALSGAVTDGHYFLHDAFKQGAHTAVIASDYGGPIPKGMSVIRVKDTLAALQMLARAVFKDRNSKRIGITGSIGKTTTKEFVATLLAPAGPVLQTEGNHNSQVGLAVSLINQYRDDEAFVVAEMGMSMASQISRLTHILPPHVALVTRVELVHAMNFSSIEKIAEAKAEIFDREETKICIFNEDTNGVDVLRRKAKNGRSFSMNPLSTTATWKMRLLDDRVMCIEEGKKFFLPKPKFIAEHIFENLLAAIAVVRSLEIPFETIIEQIPRLRLLGRRLEMVRVGGVCFINDSYNASEASMIAALQVLKKQSPQRRVAVLGKMGELGVFSESCHRNVGEVALEAADLLFCLGEECAPIVDLWRKEKRDCFWTYSLAELIEQLRIKVLPGDVVLLKGSSSNGLWKILEYFTKGS